MARGVGQLRRAASQPAHPDFAGQRLAIGAAVDVPGGSHRSVRSHAGGLERNPVYDRSAESRVGHRCEERTPDLALPALAAGRVEGLLRSGESRVRDLWQQAVHDDPRRAPAGVGSKGRQGDLGHRARRFQAWLRQHRRPAHRQGQADRGDGRRRVRESRLHRRVRPGIRQAAVALLDHPGAR